MSRWVKKTRWEVTISGHTTDVEAFNREDAVREARREMYHEGWSWNELHHPMTEVTVRALEPEAEAASRGGVAARGEREAGNEAARDRAAVDEPACPWAEPEIGEG
jgi:hypothetical protein